MVKRTTIYLILVIRIGIRLLSLCPLEHDSSLSIDFMSLPQEFNIRTTKPWIVGRGSFAYIIHGRYPDTEHHDFIDYINGDIILSGP